MINKFGTQWPYLDTPRSLTLTANSGVELVENAYKGVTSKRQFIQRLGISDDLEGRVFMSQPVPLVEAVCVVCQLESAHKACQAVCK